MQRLMTLGGAGQVAASLEDMKLEELHDRLVDIEKDNEQIRRENQLFESYITRKMKEKEKEGGMFNEATMNPQ